MTIEFGDVDPEDAWDDGDPVVIRLALLARILADVYDEALNRDVERATARKLALRNAIEKLIFDLRAETAV